MRDLYFYHHHPHVVPPARISLTLSRHFSQSFIAFGRSSGLHSVSSHSCCLYVRAGRPAFAWPYAGVHRSTSLMSLSLLLQQCPTCLVRLTCIVFVMGGKWPYSWCLVGCCRQERMLRAIYFYKEVYSFVYWSRHYQLIIFPCICKRGVVLWIYNKITGEEKLYTEKERLTTNQSAFSFFENYYEIGIGNDI